GIDELRKHIDTLVIIPNTKLLEIASKKTTMIEAFLIADDVLKQAISGITNLVNLEGVINLDFADLKTVMEDKGSALMGTGIGHGEHKGLDAVKRAINSPLISKPISGATGIIINIIADESFPLLEAEAAATYVQSTASKDADVIFGLVYDSSFKDKVSVTVIATGYEKSYKEKSTRLFRPPLRIAESFKPKKVVQKQGRETQVSKPVVSQPRHVEPTPRSVESHSRHVEPAPKPVEPRPQYVEPTPRPVETKPEPKQQPAKEEPKENTEEELDLPYFMRRR
ncbi:hypothetical protein KKA14_18135, partial [bacterium]|nr:hypothetical protein [bacterium]